LDNSFFFVPLQRDFAPRKYTLLIKACEKEMENLPTTANSPKFENKKYQY